MRVRPPPTYPTPLRRIDRSEPPTQRTNDHYNRLCRMRPHVVEPLSLAFSSLRGVQARVLYVPTPPPHAFRFRAV